MVELSDLSVIGFGCYRTDRRSRIHHKAMQLALQSGINLFDTASSYMDGRSEELIGDIISQSCQPAFIVTKLGYITPSSTEYLNRHGIDTSHLASTADGTRYSLEVSVLRHLLELSMARLRRSTIDAVLLHNPERLLDTGISQDELQRLLGNALEWLDSEVQSGRLRFYGISSNSLPTATPGDALDLDTILKIALQAGTRDRPALIEFPLNLFEQEATKREGRPSLVERAKERVKTLTNRPLNCINSGAPVRLTQPCLEETQTDYWYECMSLVSNRLEEIAPEQSWQSFRPMQFLRDYEPTGDDVDLIDAAWSNQIRPFLDTLYEQMIPSNVVDAFEGLYKESIRISRRMQAKRSDVAIDSLKMQGKLRLQPGESVAVAACRSCLDLGADHVLVGMRRPEYVQEMRALMSSS